MADEQDERRREPSVDRRGIMCDLFSEGFESQGQAEVSAHVSLLVNKFLAVFPLLQGDIVRTFQRLAVFPSYFPKAALVQPGAVCGVWRLEDSRHSNACAV